MLSIEHPLNVSDFGLLIFIEFIAIRIRVVTIQSLLTLKLIKTSLRPLLIESKIVTDGFLLVLDNTHEHLLGHLFEQLLLITRFILTLIVPRLMTAILLDYFQLFPLPEDIGPVCLLARRCSEHIRSVAF